MSRPTPRSILAAMGLACAIVSACSGAPSDPTVSSARVAPTVAMPVSTAAPEATATAAPSTSAVASSAPTSAPSSATPSVPPFEPVGSDLATLKGPKKAIAKTGAKAVLAALAHWLESHPENCPNIQDLVKDRAIVPGNANDPWGSPYEILCSNEGHRAVSFGPDELAGTRDDLVFWSNE